MEMILKVYIYRDGKKPIFHKPRLIGIYASEGWFMKLMEANREFVTKEPDKAHLFYLPYSSRQLGLSLYVRNSHNLRPLAKFLRDYVNMIASKYPFWNRTHGSDHFLVACHDWVQLPAFFFNHLLNMVIVWVVGSPAKQRTEPRLWCSLLCFADSDHLYWTSTNRPFLYMYMHGELQNLL